MLLPSTEPCSRTSSTDRWAVCSPCPCGLRAPAATPRARRSLESAADSSTEQPLAVDHGGTTDEHEPYRRRLREDADVPERVAVHDDEVGELAGLEGTETVAHPQQLGRVPRGGEECLHRREAELDVPRELAGALPVREERGARIGPHGDRERRPMGSPHAL